MSNSYFQKDLQVNGPIIIVFIRIFMYLEVFIDAHLDYVCYYSFTIFNIHVLVKMRPITGGEIRPPAIRNAASGSG